MQPSRLLLAPVALTTAVLAQITPVGPFTGTQSEGFETQSYAACVPRRVFNSHADLCTPGYSGLLVTYGWLVYVGYAMYPRNASNSFAGTTIGHGVFTFDQPVQRFGAYFGTVGSTAGGLARFYDANNRLLGTMPLTAPRGAWAWDGWDVGHTGTRIKSVELTANDPGNGGALICIEDAEMDEAVGAIERRALGCGALTIAATGLPVLGDTVTVSLGGTTAPRGFQIGRAIPALPIPGCPGCQLGVDGFSLASNRLVLDIPNDPIFLGAGLSLQGFALAGGTCFGTLSLSDAVDVWIGAAP